MCCALHFQWSKDPWRVGSSNLWTSQNKPLWLLPTSLHWTQTKALWKPKLLGERCSVWCGCEEIFSEGYLETQYFFPSSMERRRCNALRHDPNQTGFSVKKVSTALKISCPDVVECNVKQQRNSSTMRHPDANLPYTNNCASDVMSVDSSMAHPV